AAHGLPVVSGGGQLCQHHCPVAHVAAEFPQLCEAETRAFQRMLGTHVQRLATIARGDGVCTTHVPAARSTVTPTPESVRNQTSPARPSPSSRVWGGTSTAGPIRTRPVPVPSAACRRLSSAISPGARTSRTGCSLCG